MSSAAIPATLHDAIKYFADLDRCTEILAASRWPNGVKCPTCASDQVRYIKTRRLWECKTRHPKRQFSVKVGTVFEDSPIGLDKWFTAAWLIANCKNGISSHEMARDLGVTQKTAWFMDHRIRLAMQTGTFEKVAGTFEADESLIGGLARNMHWDKRKEKITGTGGAGKEIVMGLLDRETGKVRVKHVQDRQRHTLQKEIRENVAEGSEIFTDAWVGYDGLDREFVHGFVDHAERYVSGKIHTNGLENFWSLLKRGLKGTYVSVEPFHLFRYLDEQAYRYNNRKTNDAKRFIGVLDAVTGKRVTYEKLTGKAETELS
jgi:transposase-like protein